MKKFYVLEKKLTQTVPTSLRRAFILVPLMSMSILSKGNFRQLFSAKACTTTICVSAQISLLKKKPPIFLPKIIRKIICHSKF